MGQAASTSAPSSKKHKQESVPGDGGDGAPDNKRPKMAATATAAATAATASRPPPSPPTAHPELNQILSIVLDTSRQASREARVAMHRALVRIDDEPGGMHGIRGWDWTRACPDDDDGEQGATVGGGWIPPRPPSSPNEPPIPLSETVPPDSLAFYELALSASRACRSWRALAFKTVDRARAAPADLPRVLPAYAGGGLQVAARVRRVRGGPAVQRAAAPRRAPAARARREARARRGDGAGRGGGGDGAGSWWHGRRRGWGGLSREREIAAHVWCVSGSVRERQRAHTQTHKTKACAPSWQQRKEHNIVSAPPVFPPTTTATTTTNDAHNIHQVATCFFLQITRTRPLLW